MCLWPSKEDICCSLLCSYLTEHYQPLGKPKASVFTCHLECVALERNLVKMTMCLVITKRIRVKRLSSTDEISFQTPTTQTFSQQLAAEKTSGFIINKYVQL